MTSKVVSKAEGRVRARATATRRVAAETVRVVARRGPTSIVRTRHGLTMAAAGVDASNVEPGHVVLLPADPDASARALRARRCAERTGANVGVVVTDTAGRAWREGQTDIAVGAAGLLVLDDHAGRVDALRQRARGHRAGRRRRARRRRRAGPGQARPAGRSPWSAAGPTWCCPPGDDGPGAAALVRGPRARTCSGSAPARPCWPRSAAAPATARRSAPPATADELADAARPRCPGPAVTVAPDGEVRLDRPTTRAPAGRAEVAAYAHGWQARGATPVRGVRLRPVTP